MNKIWALLSFGIGAIGGYFVAKKQCEKKCRVEVEEIRAYYLDKFGSKEDKPANEPIELEIKHEVPSPAQTSLDSKSFQKAMKDYKNYASQYGAKDIPMSDINTKFVIEEDEYDVADNYDEKSLIYYKDKVVADYDDIVYSKEEVEEYLGWTNLKVLDASEDNRIYIRNTRLHIDYEVITSDKSFYGNNSSMCDAEDED